MKPTEISRPLTCEPAYGQEVGIIRFATTEAACAGHDTWTGSSFQKKSLKEGKVFHSYDQAFRAARVERARKWHRAKMAKKNGMTRREYDYWEEASQDSDFVFWAEVEAAFHKSFRKTGPGCYQMLNHHETVASLLNIAINRKHGRQESISPARLKELVSYIQEPTE